MGRVVVHDRPMLRLIALISLLLTLPALAGPLGLTCAETTAIIDQMTQYLRKIDAEKRQQAGLMGPILFQGTSFEPIQYYGNGGETRVVAKVSGADGVEVLKQFRDASAALAFVAQMNQLRAEGIAGVEVLGIDITQKTVRVKHYQLCSLDWLDSLKLPDGLMARLSPLRRAFADEVDRVGGRLQILDKNVSTTNILLDLDADSFRLIDIQ